MQRAGPNASITTSIYGFQASPSCWEVGGSAWAQPTPVVVKVAMVLGAALMIVQMISNIRGDLKSLRAKA